jgi:uncharacterized protein YllA (UPF0747 family)
MVNHQELSKVVHDSWKKTDPTLYNAITSLVSMGRSARWIQEFMRASGYNENIIAAAGAVATYYATHNLRRLKARKEQC